MRPGTSIITASPAGGFAGRLLLSSILALLFLFSSCGRIEPQADNPVLLDPALISGVRAFDEVDAFVATGPRVSGTDGAEKAASYIAGRLMELGYNPDIDEFAETVGGRDVVFRNVIAQYDGEGSGLIILGSHYDTKGGISDDFAGANDSGSSTGLLIELARVIKQSGWNGFDIIFAFFDGEECAVSYSEEDGLHGSKRLAGQLKRDGRAGGVKAVIIMDMIGDRDLSVTLPRNCTPGLSGLVFEKAREEGVRSKFELAAGNVIDDHVPFMEAGMPAVNIIDFHYGSVPGANDYWHTTNDVMDKISAESLETVGRVVIRMINAIK